VRNVPLDGDGVGGPEDIAQEVGQGHRQLLDDLDNIEPLADIAIDRDVKIGTLVRREISLSDILESCRRQARIRSSRSLRSAGFSHHRKPVFIHLVVNGAHPAPVGDAACNLPRA
jgi:hypothetical protein